MSPVSLGSKSKQNKKTSLKQAESRAEDGGDMFLRNVG
jgi:hypothetical protein